VRCGGEYLFAFFYDEHMARLKIAIAFGISSKNVLELLKISDAFRKYSAN
jgi:hypothetical protein